MGNNSKNQDTADVIVIGGGPGGYVAGLKLAMLGANVILIERDKVGGTCLNRGCIPTKALLHSVELLEQAKTSAKMGIEVGSVKVNLKQVNEYKQNVVSTLVKGVESLLKARKIQLVTGSAKFIGTKSVLVSTPGKGERIITAKNIIIATGSKPAIPTIPGIDGKNVITSNEALNFEGLPKSIAIIGGGVIGMEMSDVYSGFGVKVTIIEALERIVPNMDTEVSEEFLRNKSKKVDIYTSARVQSITDTKDKKKRVEFIKDENIAEVVVEKVLVAVGRTCNTGLLDLQEIGVGTEQSRVVIDENFETNVSGVYCIGDANGKMMLAHVASAQGIFVAELIMGKRCIISQDIVPNCIYTNPEIASVGMTEEEAKDKGIEYKVGKFRFRANGRSLILDKGEGFVKIIGSKKHNEVLGVHIIGPYATEMIAECVAVMTLEGCVEDIANIIHAHPTVSESIKEAAEDFLGGAIHSV